MFYFCKTAKFLLPFTFSYQHNECMYEIVYYIPASWNKVCVTPEPSSPSQLIFLMFGTGCKIRYTTLFPAEDSIERVYDHNGIVCGHVYIPYSKADCISFMRNIA